MKPVPIVSVHVAAAWLQATPSMIFRVAERLGIEARAEVDGGVKYFAESDVERIANYIAGHRLGGHHPFNRIV